MTEDTIRRSPNAWWLDFILAHLDIISRVLRGVLPIFRTKGRVIVMRYDDVCEVLERDQDFGVDYDANFKLATGGISFIQGLSRGKEYDAAQKMMIHAAGTDVKDRLARAADFESRALLADAKGGIEVVNYVRTVVERVLGADFGTPANSAPLALWTTRVVEFVFTGEPKGDVAAMAPEFCKHIDAAIAARKAGPPIDDVLGRALAFQSASGARSDDGEIRAMLMGLLIVGLPELPIVAPQALAQLLRRPAALARARAALEAARQKHRPEGDALLPFLTEALRFDPLAPFLKRVAIADAWIAAGTPRATLIRKNEAVQVSPLSAMLDGRRVRAPCIFDETRDGSNFLHFGHGFHRCLGAQMVSGLLPAVLAPLLDKPSLRTTQRLVKRGMFPHTYRVAWD